MKWRVLFIILMLCFNNLLAEKGFNLIATIHGESVGDAFSEVCGLGDINQDGYDDFAVGAWEDMNGGNYVNIYFGGSELDTVADLRLEGDSYFGWALDAGDFNGDGIPDLIVGAPYANYFFGNVSIFLGGKDMDNIADITMNGTHSFGLFGHDVANGGDINGDGYDDFIIGERSGWEVCGYLYIYWGGPEVDDTWEYCMQGLDFEFLGNSCDGIGDINQDGYDDIIVGTSPDETLGMNNVYIIYGGQTIDDSSFVTIPDSNDTNFGRLVAGVGDINNDSIPEFLIASGDTTYVYCGKTKDRIMIKYIKSDALSDINGPIDFNNDGTCDLILKGRDGVFAYLGREKLLQAPDYSFSMPKRATYSYCEVGDINDDGCIDLLFGNMGQYFYNDDPSELTYAEVYIYSFGEPSSTKEEITASEFDLKQNYPNPFNATTKIEFTLDKKSNIQLSIYNVQGNLVKVLEDNSLNQGDYKYTFDATGLTSGIYFYKLNYDNHSVVKKMTYLK